MVFEKLAVCLHRYLVTWLYVYNRNGLIWAFPPASTYVTSFDKNKSHGFVFGGHFPFQHDLSGIFFPHVIVRDIKS